MVTKFYLKPTTHWLIAILTLAAFFRLDLINQPFVDFVSWRQSDNATIADNFYRRNLNILYPEVSWNGLDPNYVGYEFQTLTYLAGLLYHFIGQHDWVDRIIPVLFGLWGIFALYQLICCVWDEKRALVSSAVMAFLPGSIYIERSCISDPIIAYKYFNEFLWTKPVLFLVVLGLCLRPPHQRTSHSSAQQIFEISGRVSSEASSKVLEQLRSKGADWIGIVEKQNNKLRKSNPLFLEYLERTYELKHKSPNEVIYRLLSPQEVSKP